MVLMWTNGGRFQPVRRTARRLWQDDATFRPRPLPGPTQGPSSVVMPQKPEKDPAPAPGPPPSGSKGQGTPPPAPEEVGGRNGPEPTRYGDWEVNGICSDF